MLGASNVLQWRRSVPHPWLGMEFTNLYAADVVTLEEIVQLFPLVCKGVIVEEVWSLLCFFIFFLFIFSPNTLLEQVFAPWLGPWCPLIICSYIQQFHPWGPFFYSMISFKACYIYIYMWRCWKMIALGNILFVRLVTRSFHTYEILITLSPKLLLNWPCWIKCFFFGLGIQVHAPCSVIINVVFFQMEAIRSWNDTGQPMGCSESDFRGCLGLLELC